MDDVEADFYNPKIQNLKLRKAIINSLLQLLLKGPRLPAVSHKSWFDELSNGVAVSTEIMLNFNFLNEQQLNLVITFQII